MQENLGFSSQQNQLETFSCGNNHKHFFLAVFIFDFTTAMIKCAIIHRLTLYFYFVCDLSFSFETQSNRERNIDLLSTASFSNSQVWKESQIGGYQWDSPNSKPETSFWSFTQPKEFKGFGHSCSLSGIIFLLSLFLIHTHTLTQKTISTHIYIFVDFTVFSILKLCLLLSLNCSQASQSYLLLGFNALKVLTFWCCYAQLIPSAKSSFYN